MMIDLKQNYFELFQVPVNFVVDMPAVSAAFRQLQALVHPDKFAQSSDQESRLAMQMTAHVNEAFETLKSPRLRAYYLLKLKGIEFDDEREISHDPHYLMEQLEIRESIDHVSQTEDPFDELDKITHLVKDRRTAIEQAFVESYQQDDFESAKSTAIKMRFCERVMSEIKQVEEKLDELL